jgi:hypothetical protein
VGFRIREQKGADAEPCGTRRFAYYIGVRDIDYLYAELKPKLNVLPNRDLYGRVNQSYGQRELLGLAPDGSLPRLGKRLSGIGRLTATLGLHSCFRLVSI